MTLQEFFSQNPRCALGFSGGVDSAYLLYAARQAGAQVMAYYVQSQFQPRFERDDAARLAQQLDMPWRVLPVDALQPEVAANPPDRCYHCKRLIFSAIAQAARQDGFPLVIDGTNASDDIAGRPGMRALQELGVRSPLRECGLTKAEIRQRSRQAGLFTWDKPAYACLATRIPAGTTITQSLLDLTQQAEEQLRGLGFTDFRVRYDRGCAKLQLPQAQMAQAIRLRQELLQILKPAYREVWLDLEARP